MPESSSLKQKNEEKERCFMILIISSINYDTFVRKESLLSFRLGNDRQISHMAGLCFKHFLILHPDPKKLTRALDSVRLQNNHLAFGP